MHIDSASSRPLPPIVLVVEDDPDTRELYETVLNMEGFWVADACDATSALDKAADLQPDVVITDIGLPGGCDGVAFASQLHAQSKTAEIPVVAITGRPLRDFDGAGFLQVLQKPILPEALVASVQNALRTSTRPAAAQCAGTRTCSGAPREIRTAARQRAPPGGTPERSRPTYEQPRGSRAVRTDPSLPRADARVRLHRLQAVHPDAARRQAHADDQRRGV